MVAQLAERVIVSLSRLDLTILEGRKVGVLIRFEPGDGHSARGGSIPSPSSDTTSLEGTDQAWQDQRASGELEIRNLHPLPIF